MNHATPLLELRQVSQQYGAGARRFTAVQDVNITIREGEFVALLGPSGCGKSTLLRIITGLRPPSLGEVLYRGKPVLGVNPHSTIVFQTFALFPWLSVQQNVEVALKARGMASAPRAARAVELLDKVGLDGFENAYPRELSGGMRQKVGFARAMAVEPELFCLDEPFSALDVLSAETLRNELLELWISGNIPTKAILLVTHNIEEAVFMADRIIVMEKDPGRVVADFPVTLPQWRNRKDPAFLAMVDQVYAQLAGQTQTEELEFGTAPGEPGHVRRLPDVSIDDLVGLLDYLDESEQERADIYRVAEDLKVESDDLLRLSEAAELLGFAQLAQGDILLAPLGEAFAEATILARKEIFAARLRRLPIFRWLIEQLREEEDHRLDYDTAFAELEQNMSSVDAERQLDIITRWGRYAELFSYQASTSTFSLETESKEETSE